MRGEIRLKANYHVTDGISTAKQLHHARSFPDLPQCVIGSSLYAPNYYNPHEKERLIPSLSKPDFASIPWAPAVM